MVNGVLLRNDRKRQTIFSCIHKVRAVETKSEERKVSNPNARILLEVKDINDNAPKFRKQFYKYEIKDNIPFNEPVHSPTESIDAFDPDLAENGTVAYTIIEVTRKGGGTSFNDISRFKMDEGGNLRVGQSLRDLRRKGIFPEYRILIKAEDQTEDTSLRRSAKAEVSVNVLEANDYSPQFETPHVSVSISEATAIGSRVTKLQATDKDGDEDLYLTYTIIGGNEDNTFRISKSGYLSSAKALDREMKDKYKLIVQVSDGVHKVESTVTITIDDVNDHAPEFTKSNYEFNLMENVTIGQIVGQVTALDKDDGINGKLSYSLSGKGSQYFGIKLNGEIFVKSLSTFLDKEQNDNIILQVKATDAGIPPSHDVASINIEILDVNDNAPVFSRQKYQGYIEETSPSSSKNTFVKMEQKIEAKDADKTRKNQNIRYSLSGPGSFKFSIHPVAGTVRVKKSSTIDCETKCEYRLVVIAHDQLGKGLRGQSTLLISVNDINDNVPYFEETPVLNIEPWTRVGTKLKTLKAIDKDVTAKNNKVIYLLKSGGVGKFQVDFETGELTTVDIITREPQQETYTLDLQIIDSGEPRLSSKGQVIIHTSVNKPPDVMKRHYFKVQENVTPGFTVGKINASDPNNNRSMKEKLKFSISDADNLPFTIDENTGMVATKTLLDAETTLSYTFQILVADSGYPSNTVSSTVSVDIIDVNDNPPKFSQQLYFASLVEDNSEPIQDQQVKFETPMVISDSDHNVAFQAVKFQLSGNNSELFDINSVSGEITVNTPGSIDCETRPHFNLTIISYNVVEPQLKTQASLIINVTDVNDNAPVFKGRMEFYSHPSAPVNSTLGKVAAKDNDYSSINNQIDYFLLNGSFDKFTVDKKSGEILISDELSREPLREEYSLNILAEDSGNPKKSSQVQVKIKVPLNKPPSLPKRHQFEVAENVRIGTIIGSIEAEDEEIETGSDFGNNFEYRLTSETGPFVIDKMKGDLKTQQILDAETVNEYKFLVSVIDRGIPRYTVTTSVHVIVKDINDNPPQFSSPFGYKSYILEGFEGVLPIQPELTTSDADIMEENQIVTYSLEGSESEGFVIDSRTGDVSVKPGHHLDCEYRSSYLLNITAKNKRQMATSSLEITVQDLNDHTPEFLDEYEFHVDPKTSVGKVIGQVNAVDGDQSAKNNQFGFFLQNGSWDKFSVDTQTGEIKVADDLTREPQKRLYELNIKAIDFGYPSLSSSTIVKIEVPINKPVTIAPNNIFHVSEGVKIGTKVGSVNATDPDGALGSNQTLWYILIDKDVPFQINNKSGIIVTTAELDTESMSTYQFEVEVFDSDPAPTTATTTVTVVVEDVNDNPPILSSKVYRASVVENQTNIGPVILSLNPSLSAEDKDKNPINRKVRYFLKGSNASLFKIHPKTGLIKVKKTSEFDAETEDKYILEIVVFDGIHRNRSKLVVNVEDINDNPPVFPKTYSYQVGPLTSIGTKFGKVEAQDGDATRRNNRVLYVLIQGSAGKFGVDFITAVYRRSFESLTDSGELYVSSNLTDNTQGEEYNLVIQAFDTGEPSLSGFAKVRILVTLNKPPIVNDTYVFFVKENSTTSTEIGKITVTDPDMNQNPQEEIVYVISDITGMFTINSETGLIQTQSLLDREQQEQYMFTVSVINIGAPTHTVSTTVKVIVEDINDNEPIFKSTVGYYGIYTETDLSGVVKLNQEIIATDADAEEYNRDIVYNLSGAGAQLFALNVLEGTIRVKNPVNIRCDVVDTYDLKVGDITVADNLVREPVETQYNIVVQAIDNGAPGLSSSTNISVFVPMNHPPTIKRRFYFYVLENNKAGIFIGNVVANDPDLRKVKGEKLTFFITDKSVPFWIDPSKGNIRTSDIIDRETTEMYEFKVFVKDNGLPAYTASSNIIISVKDINDNPPVFLHGQQYQGTVMEDDQNPIMGQKVELSKNVTVIDKDATTNNRQIQFSLKGAKSDLFRINSKTGTIYVARPGNIDREFDRQFHLKIVATDQNGRGHSTESDLNIHVRDVNDHKPRFVQESYEFSLPSIVKAGYKIGQLIAIDRDSTSPNNKLLYIFDSDTLGKFKIDIETGVLTLLEGFFSKPRQSTYTFTVTAMDMGFPSRKTKAQVIVNAPHMVYNDYPPKFEGHNVFIIKEEMPVGSLVGTLKVTDEDKRKNNSIHLRIAPEDEPYVPFTLKSDGSIITTEVIDRDAGYEHFRFTVHATDTGSPPHNTSQEVGIIVNDINDNPPHFTMETYQHMVSTHFPGSTIVATPFAFDDVDKTDSVYQYKLHGKNPGYFYINDQTGVVRTTNLARNLKAGMMEFTIVAQDMYNKSLTAEAKLIVRVMKKAPQKKFCCRVPC
ncbi:protocadherin Fat 4-like [Octopus vulgaris]|uniref:Protocadherin Fat 4-like n=1 Tax=Octopus vulgaris TaxID=6645 RepID=A0AA36FGY6_OCTVU|nr:protocadherin Fat 4-like [Octopus vulgaris]